MKILSFCNDSNNSSSDDVGGSVAGVRGCGGAGVPPLPGPRHTSQASEAIRMTIKLGI